MRKITLTTMAAALLAGCLTTSMAAEPVPAITFGASVTNADGTLTTRLTWSTAPAASSCTASGHPSWAGTKAASGALDLPAITLSGTYTLSLACTWAADTSAVLTWQAPTQYTDGSAIAAGALGPYRIYQGTTAANLARVAEVSGLTTTRTGLAQGQHFFAVTAVTTTGVESALSAVGSKTIGTSQTRNASVTLTVNPKPNAPPLTVE